MLLFMFIFALLAVIALLIWLATLEDKIDRVSRLEADNACYDLDSKINELKGRYRWLKSNMGE